MKMRAPLAAAIAIGLTISAAVLAFAQQLQVIGNDPVAGPICAGPLGPGPCAAVQQYILNQQQGQPGPPRVLPMPDVPGAGPPPIIDGRTAQQIAINCARQAGRYVGSFAACAGQNVILPQDQQAVLDCAVSNSGVQGFANCAAPHFGIRLSNEQRIVADCAMRSEGDRDDFLVCAGSRLANQRLTPEQQAVLNCAANAVGDASDFASCAASRIIGPRLSREQRIAVQCAAQSQGDYGTFASCAGANLFNLNLNPEQQIAVQCVVQTGGQPYAAAGCMATRLTARELEKCFTDGIGGSGCFGDNNDLVGRNGWTARTMAQIAGGPNSVIRNPSQIWGGDNSFVRNPGQIWGGSNSFVRNPSQFWGGNNSIFNNPAQLAPPPVTIGSVGGHRICLPWC
jgi:hypothetical protein